MNRQYLPEDIKISTNLCQLNITIELSDYNHNCDIVYQYILFCIVLLILFISFSTRELLCIMLQVMDTQNLLHF